MHLAVVYLFWRLCSISLYEYTIIYLSFCSWLFELFPVFVLFWDYNKHCHKYSYIRLLAHRNLHFLTSFPDGVWCKWSKKHCLWYFMFFRVIHTQHKTLLLVLTSSWGMTPMLHFGGTRTLNLYFYLQNPHCQ